MLPQNDASQALEFCYLVENTMSRRQVTNGWLSHHISELNTRLNGLSIPSSTPSGPSNWGVYFCCREKLRSLLSSTAAVKAADNLRPYLREGQPLSHDPIAHMNYAHAEIKAGKPLAALQHLLPLISRDAIFFGNIRIASTCADAYMATGNSDKATALLWSTINGCTGEENGLQRLKEKLIAIYKRNNDGEWDEDIALISLALGVNTPPRFQGVLRHRLKTYEA